MKITLPTERAAQPKANIYKENTMHTIMNEVLIMVAASGPFSMMYATILFCEQCHADSEIHNNNLKYELTQVNTTAIIDNI